MSAAGAGLIETPPTTQSSWLPPGCDHAIATVPAPGAVHAAPRTAFVPSTPVQIWVWFAAAFKMAAFLKTTAANASSPVAELTLTPGSVLVPKSEEKAPSGVV